MGCENYLRNKKIDKRYEAERKEVDLAMAFALAERVVVKGEYINLRDHLEKQLKKIFKRLLLQGVRIGRSSRYLTDHEALIAYIKTL